MEAPKKHLARLFSRILEGAAIEVGMRDPSGATSIYATGSFGKLSLRAIWAGAGWPAEVRKALPDPPPAPWPRDLVVAAHHISPGSLKMLKASDANWIDETGTARIVGPGLLISCEGAEKEAPRRAFSWSPSATAIAEALLAGSWAEGVGTTELANLVQWSPPQVSQVLQAFDEKGWTVKYGPQRGRHALRELRDAEDLLGAWAKHIANAERSSRQAHRTLRSPLGFLESELGPALSREVRWGLSGWAAGNELAPIADNVPSLQIYVHEDDFENRLDRAIREVGLDDVAEGGRVTFISAHPSVLALTQRKPIGPLVSSPRIYADLLAMGGRAEEAAEHLKEEAMPYLSQPGERSEVPAGMVEWESMCRERLRRLMRDRSDLPDVYALGTSSACYRLVGVRHPPSPRKFMAILREVAGRETGWPAWWVPESGESRPRPVDGMIESWFSEMTTDDPSNADYWRADPAGRLCLIRPLQEDFDFEIKPQTSLDLVLPVWRVGECLLHAERLAHRLDATAIQFMMRWSGIQGRQIVSLANRRRRVSGRYQATEDSVTSFIEVTPAEIGADLTKCVQRLVDALYSSFDFFEPPAQLYEEELAAMLENAR